MELAAQTQQAQARSAAQAAPAVVTARRSPAPRRSPGRLASLVLSLSLLAAATGLAPAQTSDRSDDDRERSRGGIIITIDPDETSDEAWGDDGGPGGRRQDGWDDEADDEGWQRALDDARRSAERARRQVERERRELERGQRRSRSTRFRVDFDGDHGGEIVRIGRDLVIDEDEIVENVVLIGGNLLVEGEVEEDAVVIGGTLRVSESAEIGGDAVAVGGQLQVERGAYIGGDRAEFGGLPLAIGIPSHLGRYGHWAELLSAFVCLVAGLFLAWLAHLLIGDRLGVVSQAVETDFWRSLLIGLLVVLLWCPAIILFSITVIGIPVAILLAVGVPLAGLLGFFASSIALGQRVASSVRFERQSRLGYLLVGVVGIGVLWILGTILRAMGSVLALIALGFLSAAFILFALLATVGLGALLISRFGRPPETSPPATAIETPPVTPAQAE